MLVSSLEASKSSASSWLPSCVPRFLQGSSRAGLPSTSGIETSFFSSTQIDHALLAQVDPRLFPLLPFSLFLFVFPSLLSLTQEEEKRSARSGTASTRRRTTVPLPLSLLQFVLLTGRRLSDIADARTSTEVDVCTVLHLYKRIPA